MKKMICFLMVAFIAIASSFAEYIFKKTDNGDRSYTVAAYSTKASKYDFFTCENVYGVDIGFDVDIHMFSSDVQNCFWDSWYALVYTYKTDETGCIVDISDTALIWANDDSSYHIMYIKSAWLFTNEDDMAAKSLIE